jgi:hypothetical protein
VNNNRAGESGTIPPRHGRFFEESTDWYFHTREGANVGPYRSQKEAEQGLTDFIEFIILAKPNMLSNFYASLSGTKQTETDENRAETIH